MEPRRQTLPVFIQVKTALQILWQQRDDALRLGLIPALIFFGGVVYGRDAIIVMVNLLPAGLPAEPPPGVMGPLSVLSLAWVIASCLITVNWLRFLLLGPMSAVGLGLWVGAPHVRFFLAAIALFLASFIAALILIQPLALLPSAFAIIGIMVIFALTLTAVARLVPFLIGKAIGQSMSLSQSWHVSRGNGASLATSLILVQLPLMIGLSILETLLQAVGFVDLAPIGSLFIGAVGQIAILICQASVMATAYRHMVGVRV